MKTTEELEWKRVPVKLTREMRIAIQQAFIRLSDDQLQGMHDAMLAAAPAEPAPAAPVNPHDWREWWTWAQQNPGLVYGWAATTWEGPPSVRDHQTSMHMIPLVPCWRVIELEQALATAPEPVRAEQGEGAEGVVREFLTRAKVPGKDYLYCIKPKELDALFAAAPAAPGAVDEAMVDRALIAFYGTGWHGMIPSLQASTKEAMRAAIDAALAGKDAD